MSVLRSLRVLAGCTALTPVVLAAAFVASPALGQTLTNDGTIDASAYSTPPYTALQNNGTINAPGGALEGTFTFLNNAAGAFIGGNAGISAASLGSFNNAGTVTAAASAALYVDENHVDSIVNSGLLKGTGGYQTIYVRRSVGSFFNTGTGSIEAADGAAVQIDETTDSFSNAGRLTSLATGSSAISFGGRVGSFTNATTGTIDGVYEGVSFGDGATTILNAGRITATAGYGLYAYGSGAPIDSFTNTLGGSISGTLGVFFQTDVTSITNAGTIEGTQNNGLLTIGSVGTIVNTGAISGTSEALYVSGSLGSLVNTGSISSSGSHAVDLYNGATSFSNGGTIASATDAAIRSLGGINITNSGILRGVGDAVLLYGIYDDTVTLLTGSEIYGNLDFSGGSGGDTDVLDFSRFAGTTVLDVRGLERVAAGDRTHVSNLDGFGDGTITIFDQTGATSMGNVASSVVGSIQTAIANEFGGFSAGGSIDEDGVAGYAAQPRRTSAEAAAEAAVLSELDIANPSTGKVWGTVFGGVSRDAEPVALSNVYGGLVAGTHFQLDAATRLGGLAGYSTSKFTIAGGQQVIDSQTGVLGVYGKTDLGMIELSYALLGGGSGHTSNRRVVAGGALQNATSSVGSWFVNPSLGIAVPVLSDDATEIRIAASGSYIHGGVDSYTETSPGFTAAVGALPVSVFEARLELNGDTIIGRTSAGDIRVRGKIGVLAQANMGSSNIPLDINGATTSFANPGTTTYGAYAGAGVSANVGAGLTLDGGADISARSDGTTATALKASLIGTL